MYPSMQKEYRSAKLNELLRNDSLEGGSSYETWWFLCPVSEVHVANKLPISLASQGTVWPKQRIA